MISAKNISLRSCWEMKNLIFFAKNMEIGGVEKALLTLLNSLDFGRFRVTLVLEETRGAFLEQLDKRVTVREYRLSTCRFPLLRKARNFTKRTLWTLKNRNRYDFACSYCTYSVIGSRLAQAASENCCLYVHNNYADIYPETEAFLDFFRLLRAEQFRKIVFVSNESRDSFCSRIPEAKEKTCVINNLIPSAEIRQLAAENCSFAPAPGETVFAFVGRLSESQKRLSRLLKAMALTLNARRNVRLLIIGDGPDRELCERMIKELGIADHVDMVGSQNNPYKFLARADCLVLTSDYEGFPVVFYEALVLGKDIITTVNASDEMVNICEYGTLCSKTPESVAKAMINYKKANKDCFHTENINQKRREKLYRLIEAPFVDTDFDL